MLINMLTKFYLISQKKMLKPVPYYFLIFFSLKEMVNILVSIMLIKTSFFIFCKHFIQCLLGISAMIVVLFFILFKGIESLPQTPIPKTLPPDDVDLWYFKLLMLLGDIIKIWNIKGLHHKFAKIKDMENLSLWQRLNSFANLQLL